MARVHNGEAFVWRRIENADYSGPVLVSGLSICDCRHTPVDTQANWRFSLRTLLIATTLVAVVLGLIVWLR